LVDKNTAIYQDTAGTVIQKDSSDIAVYILQHGNDLIWEVLHQISQGRQFPEIRKLLTRVQLSTTSVVAGNSGCSTQPFGR
jgi:hypothetical protein